MANIEKMKQEFSALLAKYEGAAQVREWNNAARGVNYTENKKILNTEVAGFKKRFEAAAEEVEAPAEPQA